MSTTFSLTEYVCSQSLIHHEFNRIVYLYGDKASLYSTLCSFLRKWWWFEYIVRSTGKRSTVHILSLPCSYKCKQEKCSERWLRYHLLQLYFNFIKFVPDKVKPSCGQNNAMTFKLGSLLFCNYYSCKFSVGFHFVCML